MPPVIATHLFAVVRPTLEGDESARPEAKIGTIRDRSH